MRIFDGILPKSISERRRVFQLFLIKPSHYDDDGYVIQWVRSNIPSNSLAALNGIARECVEDRVLGDEVEIEITIEDEINTRVRPEKIARTIQTSNAGGLVALVGVQSNAPIECSPQCSKVQAFRQRRAVLVGLWIS